MADVKPMSVAEFDDLQPGWGWSATPANRDAIRTALVHREWLLAALEHLPASLAPSGGPDGHPEP